MISVVNRPERTQRPRQTRATSTEQTSITAFLSELGWMAVAWRGDALEGVAFGYASRRLAELALARRPSSAQPFCRVVSERQLDDAPKWVGDAIDKLRRFADGEAVDFSDVPLNLDHLTPFGRRVVAGCRQLAWGQTASYGDLAAKCGSPGAARAVGSVMAKNRFPLIVPCHRVLAAGGELGGYSAPEGLAMKRRLLVMEGAANF